MYLIMDRWKRCKIKFFIQNSTDWITACLLSNQYQFNIMHLYWNFPLDNFFDTLMSINIRYRKSHNLSSTRRKNNNEIIFGAHILSTYNRFRKTNLNFLWKRRKITRPGQVDRWKSFFSASFDCLPNNIKIWVEFGK